ncbi:MAG: response regulator [Cyanobacteria bacterium P01_F01_bin.150]
MSKYQAGYLKECLKDLHVQQVTGVVKITTSHMHQRTSFLVLRNGEPIYCNKTIPRPEDFIIELGQRLHRDWIESSLRIALEQCTPQPTLSELLEIITRLRILRWEEIETLIYMDTIQSLEQLMPFPGHLTVERNDRFDLYFGRNRHTLSWERIWTQIGVRKRMWKRMSASVPSMEAIPKRIVEHLTEIEDIAARKHIAKWINGRRSLLDIAQELGEDPLTLGRTYSSWARLGWIACNEKVVIHTPIVLSVDDSSMVQSVLKYILGKRYQMKFASNAIDALTLMNMHDVGLLLLDITMPEMDGLEFCRIIRKIPKFKQLPIVMLTANDSIIDKIKGQFSGSNHYLVKPVDQVKLLKTIEKYVTPAQPGMHYTSKPLMTKRASEVLTASLLRMATQRTA